MVHRHGGKCALGHTNNAPNTCDAVADSGPLCGWDQTKITYATCPDPQTMNVDGSFQAVVDTAKCPNPDTMYTAPGLALSNSVVKQAGKKPPVCLTCEGDAPLAGNGSDPPGQAQIPCLPHPGAP